MAGCAGIQSQITVGLCVSAQIRCEYQSAFSLGARCSTWKALWVRRVKGKQATPAAPTPFLPVCVQAAEAPPTVHQGAITVSFRTGHQLVLHQATPDMLRQLVAALSC